VALGKVRGTPESVQLHWPRSGRREGIRSANPAARVEITRWSEPNGAAALGHHHDRRPHLGRPLRRRTGLQLGLSLSTVITGSLLAGVVLLWPQRRGPVMVRQRRDRVIARGYPERVLLSQTCLSRRSRRMGRLGGEPILAKDVATARTALKRPFAARSNQVCPRRNGTTRGSTRSLRWKAPAWLRPGSEKKWPSGMRRLADFTCSQAGSASPL
jgi:hypothetical protein